MRLWQAVETVSRPPGEYQSWMDFFSSHGVPPKPTTDGTVPAFYAEKIARRAWMPVSLRDLSPVVRWTDECPVRPGGIGNTHMSWMVGTVPRRAPENFPEPRSLTRPTGVLYRTYRLSQGWSYPCPDPIGEVTLGQVAENANRMPVKAVGIPPPPPPKSGLPPPPPPKAKSAGSTLSGGDGGTGGACGLPKGVAGFKAPPGAGEPCRRSMLAGVDSTSSSSGAQREGAALHRRMILEANYHVPPEESALPNFKAAPTCVPLPACPPMPKRRCPPPPPEVLKSWAEARALNALGLEPGPTPL